MAKLSELWMPMLGRRVTAGCSDHQRVQGLGLHMTAACRVAESADVIKLGVLFTIILELHRVSAAEQVREHRPV